MTTVSEIILNNVYAREVRPDGSVADIQFSSPVTIEVVEVDEPENFFRVPRPPIYKAEFKPNAEGHIFVMRTLPPSPAEKPEEWTETGIHKPTMEAVYLVLSSFTGMDEDMLKRVVGAIEAGPVRA